MKLRIFMLPMVIALAFSACKRQGEDSALGDTDEAAPAAEAPVAPRIQINPVNRRPAHPPVEPEAEVEDDFAAGFVFENPNAKGACGCGESFTV